MKKLVQKVVDINPSYTTSPEILQKYLDKKSSEGWEFCGQIGLFYVFKRWEEVANVVDNSNGNVWNGGSYGGSTNNYGSYYSQFRPQVYQPYNPNPQPQTYQQPQYNPGQFGVRVKPDEDDAVYPGNPFDD